MPLHVITEELERAENALAARRCRTAFHAIVAAATHIGEVSGAIKVRSQSEAQAHALIAKTLGPHVNHMNDLMDELQEMCL